MIIHECNINENVLNNWHNMHVILFVDITILLRFQFCINEPEHVKLAPSQHCRLEHVIIEPNFVHHDACLSTTFLTHLHIGPLTDCAFHLHKLCITYEINIITSSKTTV